MEYGKSDLKRILLNSPREGWTTQKINDLVDSLWRDKYPGPDEVIIGGVTWNSGLSFTGSAAKYRINNKFYRAQQNTFTLDAADATYPRIDLITLNVDGEWEVIKGTPAENPLKPSYNRDTNVEVTYVYLPAGATEPEYIEDPAIDKYVTGISWNEETGILTLTRSGGLPDLTAEITGAGGGADGREVEISVQGGWVCWRYVGGSTWTQLYQVPDTDNSVEIYIDFPDTTPFIFTAPYAMKFTSQNAENGAATISPALNTNLAQYDDVTITPAAAGLVTLTGEKL